MTYRAPVADIAFALKHAAGFGAALGDGLYGDLDEQTVEAVLEEAGRFASDVIAPLNSVGDRHGTPFKDGAVTTPPGWKEAYTAWAAAGWNGLTAPAVWGGQDLPHAVNAACVEMWNSASMAFGIGPVLTMGATFIAYACALLAYLYLVFTSPAYNATGTYTPVVVAFAFLIGLQIANIFTTPIGSGMDTIFVAMAWDPEVLMRDHPDLYQQMIAVYPHVQQAIHA